MDGGRRLGAFPRSPRSFIRKCRRRSRNGATEIRLFTGAVVSRARCASSRALATRTRKPALASRRESPSSFATRLKSLVTLLLSGVFAYLAITGQTSQEFMTVYTVVIAFYFGTQTQKISDAVDKTLKGE